MSKIITGLLVAGVGSLIASFALSDSCTSEIMAKIVPFLGTVPGLALSWFARVKQGDVTVLGVRKY
jgi:hypothetical protein